MKRFIAAIAFALCFNNMWAQTATDFTATDCGGTQHHLFDELNAGKVVVISFVMPCSACIGPSKSAQATVQTYEASNPGKVVYYIADDDGGTPCSTVSAWAKNNSIESVPVFSNTAVTEMPYGTGGMPKIVVLGGADHKVFFTQNGGLNTSNFSSAINAALAATPVKEQSILEPRLTVYPNPAKDKIAVGYTLRQPGEVSIEIYNILGVKVTALAPEQALAGNHEAEVNIEALQNGVYFLKVRAGAFSQIIKFTAQ